MKKRDTQSIKQKILIDLTKRLQFRFFNCNVSISHFITFFFYNGTNRHDIYLNVLSGILVELLSSCSKKSSTSSTNKCLPRLVHSPLFHPPSLPPGRTPKASPSLQANPNFCDMTTWIATRDLTGLMNCTKYILDITSMFLTQFVIAVTAERCLDAKKLDKTSGTWS